MTGRPMPGNSGGQPVQFPGRHRRPADLLHDLANGQLSLAEHAIPIRLSFGR